jgi:peptidoglycan LD-endopeptidase CwlK
MSIPPEPPVSDSLLLLAPKVAQAAAEALNNAWRAGLDPIVFETVRSVDRQAWLYGVGRTHSLHRTPVTRVRDARTGWHHYGVALDVISRSKHWGSEAFFRQLAPHFKAQGFRWGGDPWMGFFDGPHFQWGPPMRTSPSDRARELLAAGGVAAVWKEVGLG